MFEFTPTGSQAKKNLLPGLCGLARSPWPALLPWPLSPRAVNPRRVDSLDPPPCAPANGRPGFPFGFLGAGGRLPKARRGRVLLRPRRRFVVSVITFVPRYLHAGDCGFPFVSYTQSRPRLGLAARSHDVATHPGVRGFCHWAGELTGRQAAESPSRRAAERASARNSSSPCPHRPQGPFKTCPANTKAGHRRVPAFASSHHPLTRTLGQLQWPEPPRFSDATTTSPAPFGEPSLSRAPTTRSLRAGPSRP